jgi:hypothetical protein
VIPTPVVSNYSYLLTNQTDHSDSPSQDLEELFSYDNYLNFLDQFMEDAESAKAQENNLNTSQKDISYNPPVLNLLLEKTL